MLKLLPEDGQSQKGAPHFQGSHNALKPRYHMVSRAHKMAKILMTIIDHTPPVSSKSTASKFFEIASRLAREKHPPREPMTSAQLSGYHDSDRIACIGWDHHAMWELANNISDKTEEEKTEEAENVRKETMKDHREFIVDTKKKGRNGPMSEREKLEKCKDSYAVRCSMPGIWDTCAYLNINIATGPKAGFLEAALDFGITGGTMLLASNKSDLHAYVALTSEEYESDIEDHD
jgi:hypothetical protein